MAVGSGGHAKGFGAIIAIEEWRKHGLIVPVCVLGMCLVALHPYTIGVMFVPLEEAFGWSRSEISGGPLIAAIGTLLLAPFGGHAVDRYGPRRIALIGVPFFAACVALIGATGPSIWSWWGAYALLALSLVMIYPSVWTAAIVPRFNLNRGLALAITLSGTGLAAVIFPNLAARLVEAYSWREAYYALGALALVIFYPLVFLLFDRKPPEHLESDDDGDPMAEEAPPSEIASPKFLRLAGAGLIHSIAATMLGINLVPILMEGGFQLVRAAEIAGIMGIGTITGRILGGFLLDHFDGRWIAVASGLGALAAAMLLFAFPGSTEAAMLACLCLGLAAGAEYDACAYLTTRHFHRGNFAMLFGTIGGLAGMGAGLSPFIANVVYDVAGSYDPVLLAIAPVLLIACLLFISLGPYPERVAHGQANA